MPPMPELERAADALLGAEGAVFSTHVHPDGDALGSELALALALEKLGKRVRILNADRAPDMYAFLPFAARLEVWDGGTPPDVSKAVGVAVECPDPSRMGRTADVVLRCRSVVNLDHHPSNTRYGQINVVEAQLSSVAELVGRLIACLEEKSGRSLMDRDTATCLYVALLTDTGRFCYSSTSSESHQAAAAWLAYGVDPYDVSSKIYEASSWERLQLLARSLATLSRSPSGKVAWLTITKAMMRETGSAADDTEGFVNFPRSLQRVQVALVFRETPSGQVKVSLRSKGVVDVNLLAQRLGGGGHARAAGATIDGPMEAAVSRVVSFLDAELA